MHSTVFRSKSSSPRSIHTRYDSSGQLTGAEYSGLTDESYSYDDSGNRTNAGYLTDDNNQLLCDGTYRYEYDGEGNRTMRYVWTDADTDGIVDVGERSQLSEYAWDYRNRLTTVTNRATEGGAATQVVSYTYDASNRMVSRTLDADGAGTGVATTSYYVYDGTQIALEFDGSAAADLSHRYLWGQAVDEILADEQVSNLNTPGDVLWPLTDNQGTVRDLATYDSQTDVTTIANHRTYNAYGQMTGETNSAVDHLFAYTGRLLDEAIGLQNNLNRWYDARVGKWLSEDPIGYKAGDANVYRYVGNRPTVASDPQGLEPIELVHATKSAFVPSIIRDGLDPGLDGLRWLASPEIAGAGASHEANVQLKYRVDVKQVRDIPQSILKEAEKSANQMLKGTHLTPEARSVRWARLKWDCVAEWIKSQPEQVFRTADPSKRPGLWYAFRDGGWKAGKPALLKISGQGAGAAVNALSGGADQAVASAAAGRWGARVKFAGRIAGRGLVLVVAGSSLYDVYTATNKSREVTKQLGAWAGAWAGAKAGASAGAATGAAIAGVGGQLGPQVAMPEELVTVPLSAVIGGAIGGVAGGIGGFWAGGKITETVYDMLFEEGF